MPSDIHYKGKQWRVSGSQDSFAALLHVSSKTITKLEVVQLDAVEQQKRVGGRRGKFRLHVAGVLVIPRVPFFL